MKRRIISILLLIALCLSTVAQAAGIKIYSDEEVRAIAEKLEIFGIFSKFDDDEFFGETTAVKRCEAAKAVVSLLGMEVDSKNDTVSGIYLDVPPYHDYIGIISSVVEMGIMTGSGDGRFNPDGEITVEQFLKTIISALGYRWKAESYGGYPTGYHRIASELKLKEGVSAGMNSVLTRGDLIRILFNSLDTPLCITDSVSKESTRFEINEDVTVLTEYHDIFKKEGVVLSNSASSINSSFEPEAGKVLIGTDEMNVGAFTNISSYFCMNVEYYYKEDFDTGVKTLLVAEPLAQNKVTYININNFISVEGNEINYKDKSGKKASLALADSVNLLYNGELTNVGIADKIASFTGQITLVENNSARGVDVVIVENPTYDKVVSVEKTLNRIYGENGVYYLEDYKRTSITLAPLGDVVSVSDVKAGDIIAVTKGESGDSINIKVVRTSTNVTIDALSDHYMSLSDGREVYISPYLSEKQMQLVKAGKAVKLTVDNDEVAVWIEEVSAGAMEIGYLIKAYESESTGTKKMSRVRLLTSGNSINIIELNPTKKKIKINGTNVDVKEAVELLANIKRSINVGGDGKVSQVIQYKTDEEGYLTEINTALPSGDGELYIKWNFKDDGNARVREHGWNSGFYGLDVSPYSYPYALTNTFPIFQVPTEDQEELEDSFYLKTTYSNSRIPMQGGYKFDTYTGDKLDIVPQAMVYFKTTSTNAPTNSTFFLIDEARVAANSEGEYLWRITGLYAGATSSKWIDSSIDVSTLKAVADSNEEPGLTQGDIVWFRTNPAGDISVIEKLFDCETETIKTSLATAEINATASIRYMHAYNAPAGSDFVEGFTQDLAEGVPGDDKIMLFNYIPVIKGTFDLYTYDANAQKISLGKQGDIIGYLQDNTNYSRIIIKYESSYQAECIIYNK